MSNFEIIDAGNGRIIKAWKKGVWFEEKAVQQLIDTAQLPFIFRYVAALPDTHWGMGGPVGGVVPTRGAVVPALCGVDIGCGMAAIRTELTFADFEGKLPRVRRTIEDLVPAGRTHNGGPGDRGAWGTPPRQAVDIWYEQFNAKYEDLCERHPNMRAKNTVNQLGTLGTGNHFIELSLDEEGKVWIVLHSGSRGLGNKIGSYFTDVAKKLCAKWFINLPNQDLAYLPQDTEEFRDYRAAVELAQSFALQNRAYMMRSVFMALSQAGVKGGLAVVGDLTIQCHHNYIAWENHFGENVIVTRKGAVRARKGDLCIIPGSMGTPTYIAEGLGNTDSFCTCSHGAGRAMSRTEAVRTFTVEDHQKATEGVECIKDASVLDETPGAYKDVEAVMAAQTDLVKVRYKLKQFLNVKGVSDGTHR